MVRRIAIVAVLVAAAVLGGAFWLWRAHVSSVLAAVGGDRALAERFAASGTPAGQVVAALARDGLRVAVVQRRPGTPRALGAPPPGMPLRGPASPPGVPPQRGGLFTRLAESSLPPPDRPVRIGGVGVLVLPDVRELGAFLAAETWSVVVLLALIGSGAGALVAAEVRLERRRLEALAHERRAAAAEYQRFLADGGHELRTPLTIVSGYVDVLANLLPDGATERRIIDGMRAETARMRALVEKMLLLARLETPVAVPRLVDVATVAAEAAETMRTRFPGRDVRLCAADGGANVVIDRDDLYEALHNLIENALRYAPESAVEVDVRAGGAQAEIAVRDSGPGIEPGEQSKIFARFYRGAAQTDGEGSGLGLSIVSRVAARWSGSLELQSAAGATAFTLRFPLAEEVPA